MIIAYGYAGVSNASVALCEPRHVLSDVFNDSNYFVSRNQLIP